MTGTTSQRTGRTTSSSVHDPISGDLKTTLRALKLGKMLDTLPERLALAKQQHLAHADFLELVLADEVSCRETGSAALRARAAALEAGMRLDTWDGSAAVSYDRQLWSELTTLRFVDASFGGIDLGAGRHRQDTPGHRARPYRRPPPLQHPHGPRRQAVQTAHRRLRALGPGPDRDSRLLRTHRGTPPQSHHRGDLQPRARRVARHDGRSTAGPVRRRPAGLSRARPHRRGPVLPDPPTTHHPTRRRPGHRSVDRDEPREITVIDYTTRWSLPRGNQVVPSPWQSTLKLLRWIRMPAIRH